MSDVIKIAGIAGSLRKGSYNKSALRAAVKLAPRSSSLDILDLDGIPGFNEDLEQNFPPPAQQFKDKVKAGGCDFDCDPGVQLLGAGCAEKRD